MLLLTCAEINKEEDYILVNASLDMLNKAEKVIENLYPSIVINRWDSFLLLSGNLYHIIVNLDEDSDHLTMLKTIYLACGHAFYNEDNSANSTGYSLEFRLKTEKLRDLTLSLLGEFGFDFKVSKRGSVYNVYTKNSSVMSDLFVVLGASNVALEIQNQLAMRELRNNINRQNNCFESNLDKTLSASEEQLKAINYIVDHYSIDHFDENLKEVALARIANPDVSLNDLKTILQNKLSRAGIKYRLDKIIEMYKSLKGEN